MTTSAITPDVERLKARLKNDLDGRRLRYSHGIWKAARGSSMSGCPSRQAARSSMSGVAPASWR